MRIDEADPKGLIRESYRMEGISLEECRSIFVDWALGLPPGQESGPALGVLVAHYAKLSPDHPMSGILNEALLPAATPRRRGGKAARQIS